MVNGGFMSWVNGDTAFQVLITLSLPAANASHAQPLPNWVTYIIIMCVSQILLWRRFGGPTNSAEEGKLFIATLPKHEDDECDYGDCNDNTGPHTRLKNVPDDPTAGHYGQQRGETCTS